MARVFWRAVHFTVSLLLATIRIVQMFAMCELESMVTVRCIKDRSTHILCPCGGQDMDIYDEFHGDISQLKM
eukprot:SAG31_NODE_2277_length_6027_cov_4.019062_6_plen_72_part_00